MRHIMYCGGSKPVMTALRFEKSYHKITISTCILTRSSGRLATALGVSVLTISNFLEKMRT